MSAHLLKFRGPPLPRERAVDVDAIVLICRMNRHAIDRRDAYLAWDAHSDAQGSTWLPVRMEDADTVFAAVRAQCHRF